MSLSTCFVIMPIGDQQIGDFKLTASELKSKYDDLIKEAILKAKPFIEVVRADEVSAPGLITSDIITRIMHSDIVIVDVTYPNPNVFYELGLRHACRCGTIIIKDKNGPSIPFDIAHLRYIEYENTASGLKLLSDKLKQFIDYIEKYPEKPDNQLLEFAKLTGYSFPNYSKPEYTEQDAQLEFLSLVTQSPQMFEILKRTISGEKVEQGELIGELFKDPSIALKLFTALVKSGAIK